MDAQEESHRMWLKCQEEAGPDEQVCCVYKGDQPLYFVMDKEASDEAIDLKAFEVRNGRPLSDAELTIRAIHKQRISIPFDPWAAISG